MHIDVYHQLQKSDSKQLKADTLAHCIRTIVKLDFDDLAKGINDALTGMIWREDTQVVSLTVRKFYAVDPRAEIIIH